MELKLHPEKLLISQKEISTCVFGFFSFPCELIYSGTSAACADVSQIFISGINLSSEFQNPIGCALGCPKATCGSACLKMNEWDANTQLSQQGISSTLDSVYPP